MDINDQKFNMIKQVFAHKDMVNGRQRSKQRLTKKGHFYQSDLDHIRYGMNCLLDNGVLDSTKPFFDAGAGDGRVIAVTSMVFDMSSYGLEYDSRVVDDGLWKIEQLNSTGLINWEIPFMLRQGDFTLDSSYDSLHIKFEDIGTFFNFDNSYHDIARKINSQSPPGTIFIFMRIIPRIEQFNGLRFITQINLSDDVALRYNFCVYEKRTQ